jgi:hypothetical protein
MEKKQDTYARAYALLSSLRDNINQMKDYSIEDTYVSEYHAVLDRLESIGVDVSDFRVPDSEVRPRVTAAWEGGQSYSDGKYVKRSFLLVKLDAILGYFKILTSEPPRTIGFTPPDKR